MEKKIKTAVIYARYSSDSQTEQSIDGQLRVCEEYAKRNDILVLAKYIDRAMTGTNDLRPDFQRMIKDSARKEWNYVLVYKLDRFSRNKYENTIHKNTLKKNGVKVLSAMENIPDSPEGTILESLLEGMSQYYSEELSQKVKRGMRENRAKGYHQGGVLPYGYKTENKKIVIDEEKAEIVRYIFEQYSLGVIVADIIKALTSMGVLCRGKPFARNTIYGILKNIKYSGVYYYGNERIDNMYPQIVPTDIFEIVRAKAKQNATGKKSVKTVYLFRHKLKCGYCGSSISAETGTARNGEVKRYYKCLGRKVYHNGCEQNIHSKKELEEAVMTAIRKEFSKPQTINVIVKNLLKMQDRYFAENQRLNTLKREKSKVDKALDNVMAAIEQGIVSKTTNKRLHELEEQQEMLEKEILIEKSKTAVKVPEQTIREYYEEAIKLEDNMIINYFIKEIILYNDRVEIHINSPFTNGPDESQGFSFYTGYIYTKSKQPIGIEMYVG